VELQKKLDAIKKMTLVFSLESQKQVLGKFNVKRNPIEIKEISYQLERIGIENKIS